NGVLPREWKQGNLTAILKPGHSALDLASFQPIVLTNCACKIMERVILLRIT
ncbi:hypothetical protein IscW_ISCW009017, partial [Ixodes scapularis]